jgi:MOSC domain-containing protein YiiM
MKLISVNIGTPKEYLFGERRVVTAFLKTPVSGPVRAGRTNLEGDGQADLSVHGGADKAVYAYSLRNIAYWKERLGRDDLGPGSFGENFTLDEFTDDEVALGDVLEIGTARFEVTQPRFPCYKMGLALDDPDLPKLFHLSGRNGFYLRVLQEGFIQAGDEIRLVPGSHAPRLTVAEFVRIATSHEIAPEDQALIQASPVVPESWKKHLAEGE